MVLENTRKRRREFDLTPAGIVRCLDLERPLYCPTAAYGHFGRADLDLPWENVDAIAETLRQATADRVAAGAGA